MKRRDLAAARRYARALLDVALAAGRAPTRCATSCARRATLLGATRPAAALPHPAIAAERKRSRAGGVGRGASALLGAAGPADRRAAGWSCCRPSSAPTRSLERAARRADGGGGDGGALTEAQQAAAAAGAAPRPRPRASSSRGGGPEGAGRRAGHDGRPHLRRDRARASPALRRHSAKGTREHGDSRRRDHPHHQGAARRLHRRRGRGRGGHRALGGRRHRPHPRPRALHGGRAAGAAARRDGASR